MKFAESSLWLITWMVFCFIGIQCAPCPKHCKCTQASVKCINTGLNNVPKEIPSSVRYLDLSENPNLKLRNDSFVRFTQLETLRLQGCSLKNSFTLPKNVRYLDFSDNFLTVKSLRELFEKSMAQDVKEIFVKNNSLRLDNNLSLLPKTVVKLCLNFNSLQKIDEEDLHEFKSLRELSIRNVGLQRIGRGSFNTLTKLSTLDMTNNNLSALPKQLFLYNHLLSQLILEENAIEEMPDLRGVSSLIYLDLSNNRIKKVSNITKISIYHLDLASNQIEEFNLTGLRYIKLDLSHNRLQKIKGQSLSSAPATFGSIFLQSNSISYIDENAFKDMKYIVELYLHRNKIKKLPQGVFKNLSIRKLSLFENDLETMDGVLEGMKRQPDLLLLFGNKKLNVLRNRDYKGMPNGSQIYITCDSLKKIASNFDLKAKVICSPSKDLLIKTSTGALTGDGFDCKVSGNTKYYYECRPCPAGQYDRRECVACPAGGFYQDQMATISCKSCPLGQYVPLDKAPGKSPLECLTCPKGTNTNSSAGYRACPCLDGYARSNRFGECEKCTQKGFQCERDYQELQRGYWMSWSNMNTLSNRTCKSSFESFMYNLDTKNDTYDRKTTKFECHMPSPHKCPMKDSCLGGVNADCKHGYAGVLCAVCDAGFMRSFNQCTECPSPVISILQCVAYFLAFVFICWLMSRVARIKLSGNDDENQQKTFADLIQSSLKILMGFYQVLVGIIHAFSHIHWPRSMQNAVSIFEIIQFSILRIPALHCVRPEWRMNAVNEFWFSLIATFAVLLLIMIYFILKSLFSYCCSIKTHEFKGKLVKNIKHCLQDIILFLFATYSLTSRMVFQILPASCHTFCTVERNGQCLHSISYLRSDYSIRCDAASNDDNATTKMTYVALLLPLGSPCLLLYLLWRFAPRARQVDTAEQRGINWSVNDFDAADSEQPLLSRANEKDSIAEFALKIIYGNYKSNCWYWEVIELIRKLVTTIASSLLLQNIKMGLFGNIVLSIVFAMFHAAKWPMKDRFDNWMQLLALVSVSVNLCYGVTQASDIGDAAIIKEDKDEWGLGIILVILNSLLLILVLGRLIKEVVMKILKSDGNGNCCGKCCHCFNFGGNSSKNILKRGERDIHL